MKQFNAFESARNIVHTLLSQYERRLITATMIEEAADNVYKMALFDSVIREDLIEQVTADLGILKGEISVLQDDTVRPWLAEAEAGIDWQLWNRYRLYLQSEDPSFPVSALDEQTKLILDKCVNPKTAGAWDRRGMAVGNVQSGKTASYTGLINKATDAGYKLIIVIAGIHNSLRAQTQKRIDKGFIGRSSEDLLSRHQKTIGVGRYASRHTIYSYTSSAEDGDFSLPIAGRLNVPIGSESPTVLVIKKQKSILENLILWLKDYAVQDEEGRLKIKGIPALIIDDEADNASINTGDLNDVKTINRLIRVLLNLFEQNTFIGYTATPYANLFIPDKWNTELETVIRGITFQIGEDLFPRDFILNIKPPSNYIGPVRLFGYDNPDTGESFDGMNIIRYVNDQEPNFPLKIERKNAGDLPEDIPGSLKKAILSFMLTCAVRRMRGHEKKHNSMLVHAALYVKWIDRIARLVSEQLNDYKNQIIAGQGPVLQQLKDLFERDYAPETADFIESFTAYRDPRIKNHTWQEVRDELRQAVSRIEVRAVHGVSSLRNLEYGNIQELNYDLYENGLSVIAVGGNRLSRGITLEGLSVSYYLRTSTMYDSLMQMGRWFGYRPGYADLCRLFTVEELVKWYRHITLATEEMKDDFDELFARGLKPVDFSLKVRNHSGKLSITAANKMRGAILSQVSFSGDIKQTYQFSKQPAVISRNFEAAQKLFLILPQPTELKVSGLTNFYLWKQANSVAVSTFLNEYSTQQPAIRGDVITAYLNQLEARNEAISWTVALFSSSEKKVTLLRRKPESEQIEEIEETPAEFPVQFSGIGQRNVRLTIRNEAKTNGPEAKDYILSKSAILSQQHLQLDLDFSKRKGGGTPTAAEVRAQRALEQKGLLIVYLLDPRCTVNTDMAVPFTGFGLCFPKLNSNDSVEYAFRSGGDDFDAAAHQGDEPGNA